jgi:D-alanyl-lipoteichoic acid acyltransferase DltB (MBOAT superfamily)
MFHIIKIVAVSVAVVVALIAYVPYLIDMFKGKNKPHLYTWISIFLVTAIVAYIQVLGGAGVGAIPTILGVGVDGIILFYCFKFGTKDVVLMDKVCLAITIIGVIAYVILSSRPVISLAIVTAAEIISFIPTFRKTRNDEL